MRGKVGSRVAPKRMEAGLRPVAYRNFEKGHVWSLTGVPMIDD